MLASHEKPKLPASRSKSGNLQTKNVSTTTANLANCGFSRKNTYAAAQKLQQLQQITPTQTLFKPKIFVLAALRHFEPAFCQTFPNLALAILQSIGLLSLPPLHAKRGGLLSILPPKEAFRDRCQKATIH